MSGPPKYESASAKRGQAAVMERAARDEMGRRAAKAR
jgi:hypothetical protein